MSKEGNIDNIFKDKLSELEVAPSDAVWGRIESDLNSKSLRKFWVFTLVLLLISTMVIGGLIYEKPSSPAIHMNESNPEFKPNTTSKEQVTPVENETQVAASTLNFSQTKTNTPTTQTSQAPSDKTDKRTNKELNQQTKKNEQNSESNLANTKTGIVNSNSNRQKADIIPLVQIGVSTTVQNNPSFSLAEVNETSEKQIAIAVIDDLKSGFEPDFIQSLPSEFPPIFPLFNQSKRGNESSEINRQWMVGLFAGANWNLKHLMYNSQAQLMVVDSVLSRESNTTTFLYGASIAMNWKKNWRITTGISYSKWCRKASYPIDIPVDLNSIATNPNGDFSTNIGGSTGDQNVNVPNDQISNFEALSPIPSILAFDLQVHECYEIVSIPLRMGYELFFSEFSLVPEIGFGYNRVIGNTLEVLASNELDPIDFERQGSFNKNLFSFSGSLGIERYLSPQFKIGVNGVYNYAITPLYKSDQFSTHPYTISGQVRLWYIFSK